MNYQKQYADKINWKNSPDTSTPLNATNLNKMDNALWYMDTALYTISKAIGGGSSARGGIISNVGNNAFTTHVHQRTGESLAENELLILRSDVRGTGNSINVYTDASSAVGFDLLDLDGESTSITVTTDSVVVLMITDADADYTAQVLAVIDTAGGVAYSGLGIGKKTGVSSNVIDTDIDLHRSPMAGDRLLVYFDEKITDPTGLKTYNNGVAVTSNLENATPLYINAGWNILQFMNDGLLYNNVWVRKQNVPVLTTLAGMSDTLIVSPSDDQLLVYDNGKWKNQKYIEANVGFSDTELKKIKVGNIVYDTDGLRDYSVTNIANNNITISVLNSNQFVMENIAINTGNHSGSSNGWNLILNDGMNPVSVALKNADGTPFADDIHENELLFVYVDTAGNVARVLEIHSHDVEVLKDICITEKTVSGNPVTVTDALPYNAVSLSAEIEPSQDLHGQSAPYVGGASKNKQPLDIASIKASNTSGTWSGNVYSYSGGTIEILTDNGGNAYAVKINGTFTSTFSFNLSTATDNVSGQSLRGTYIASRGSGNLPTNCNYSIMKSTSGFWDFGTESTSLTLTFTDAEHWGGRTHIFISNNSYWNNIIIYPMMRADGTSADFEQWENKCPISGRTETSVDDVGKNYYNIADLRKDGDVTYTVNNGTLTITSRAVRPKVYFAPPDKFGGKNVTFSFKIDSITNGGGAVFFGLVIRNKATSTYRYASASNCTTTGNKSVSAVLAAEETIERIDFNVNDSSSALSSDRTYVLSNIQFEIGSTATAYAPYVAPHTATIQLGTTVYGGTLNVTTGVLTITHVIADLGTNQSDWYMASTNTSGKQRLAVQISDIKTRCALLCNVFADVTGSETYQCVEGVGTDTNLRITLYKDDLQTLDAWKAWATDNNLQVCYELATPTTIQLTPTQLTMLKGYNRLSSDGGGDITLTYKADRLAAIEAALAEIGA